MTAKADKLMVGSDGDALRRRLSRIPQAKGMYTRQTGTKLILGRRTRTGMGDEVAEDDRLKLTAQGRGTYSLSVRTWKGRWERTGFEGTITGLIEIIRDVLGHYLTDEDGPSGEPPPHPPRTSAQRH